MRQIGNGCDGILADVDAVLPSSQGRGGGGCAQDPRCHEAERANHLRRIFRAWCAPWVQNQGLPDAQRPTIMRMLFDYIVVIV